MRFVELEDVLEEKLENILKSTGMRKKIFVWGYRGGGKIICNLLKQKGISNWGIIDSTYEKDGLEIKKPNCLREINPNNAIILLCMKDSADLEDELEDLEFRKGFSYFSMVEQIYGDCNHVLSPRHWIEYQGGADISAGKNNRDGECMEYTPTPWESLYKIMVSIDIQKNDALLDYGMGKGGGIIYLALRGLFGSFAGVERDEELYRIACENFNRLEIKNVKAIYSDAQKVTDELDAYNYFFFYNPFSGSVFESVLQNIKDSYKRKKRRIRIIYINTICHDMIMASKIFRLEKQVEVAHFIPLANIYTTEIEERR